MNSENISNSLVEGSREKLPESIHWWLSLFAFFLAFPAINIAGVSITFYFFFIVLVLHIKSHIPILTKDKSNKWFVLLFITGVISTVFHPQLNVEVTFFTDVKTISQYFYWFLLAMYLRSNFHLLDLWRFSRALLFGLIALVIGYYLIPLKLSLGIIDINFGSSRNGFVYNLLCFFPTIFWFLKYSSLRKISWIFIIFFFLSIIFSNGRAGFILIIIQTLILGIIVFPSISRIFKMGLLFLGLFFLTWQFFSNVEMSNYLADKIQQINPRMASMLNKSGSEGDLTKDKSWLIRKLMIDKTIEVVRKYPAFGLGWMHFEKYFSELSTLDNYKRLKSLNNEFLNTRSSHNSYAMYIAEGGIVGFTILIILILTTVTPFFSRVFNSELSIIDLPLVTLITLAIYFYAISSITGAGTWFVIGASLGCARNVFSEEKE